MKPSFTTILALSLAWLLSACATEYRFTAPTTPEAQRCIASCGNKQEACRVKEEVRTAENNRLCQARYQAEQAQCEHDADIEYTACLKYSDDKKEKRCKRNSCHGYSCERSPSFAGCASDYRICFQACGGTISIIE